MSPLVTGGVKRVLRTMAGQIKCLKAFWASRDRNNVDESLVTCNRKSMTNAPPTMIAWMINEFMVERIESSGLAILKEGVS